MYIIEVIDQYTSEHNLRYCSWLTKYSDSEIRRFLISIIAYSKQFFYYAVIGIFCATIDLVVFHFLIMLSRRLEIINFVSTLFGVSLSYILNARLTFKNYIRTKGSLLRYFVVGTVGYFISTLFLIIFVSAFRFSPITAKVLSIPIISILQFMLNRTWSFKKRDMVF